MSESKITKALVLGGAGQIGKPLCEYLARNGVKPYNIDLVLGEDHDLRVLNQRSLVEYWMKEVDFVFFLAYDIGGSKFLKTRQGEYQFLMNNTMIMANVFSLLEKHKKPFIFASSAMADMSWSPYGDLKRIGEHFTASLGGIVTRFWNVYGPEHDEEKAHVITDFIKKARETGLIDMMTDGSEVRQFLYADDCSDAMFTLAKNYAEASKHGKFDVTNFVWTDIYSIAKIIADHYDAEVQRAEAKDTVQFDTQIQPKRNPLELFWSPENAVTIEEGIKEMIEYYEKQDD